MNENTHSEGPLGKRVTALESALSAILSMHQKDDSYRFDGLDSGLDAVKKDIRDLTEFLGTRDDRLKKDLESSLRRYIDKLNSGTHVAIGNVVKDTKTELRAEQRSAVAGLQSEAKIAQHIASQPVAVAESVMVARCYAYNADVIPGVIKRQETDVRRFLDGVDDWHSSLERKVRRQPEGDSIGDLVVALAVETNDPTPPDLKYSIEQYQGKARDRLRDLLHRPDETVAQGDDLVAALEHIKGVEAIPATAPDDVQLAARTLRAASASGQPIDSIVKRCDGQVLAGLARLKDFRSRMDARWHEVLSIACASGSEQIFQSAAEVEDDESTRDFYLSEMRAARKELASRRKAYRAKYSK